MNLTGNTTALVQHSFQDLLGNQSRARTKVLLKRVPRVTASDGVPT